mmetsp:Transcript_28440/g.60960  ORF Transcript_28440/g.60960 Transcript_28440/m.60960 type:complete len:293 (+) Transcript_28440:655-1533(+)
MIRSGAGRSLFLVQATGQEQFSEPSADVFVHLLAVVLDLVRDQEALHSLRSLGSGPAGLGFVVAPRQVPRVVLEFLLLSRQLVDPPAQRLEVFFQVRLRAHVQPVQGDVRSGGPVLQHGVGQARVRAFYGKLFEYLGGFDKVVRPGALHPHALVGQPEGPETKVSLRRLQRIVENHDGVRGDLRLVGKLALEDGRGRVNPEVHRLIGPDAVVVHVHLAEHAHHFELIVLVDVLVALAGRIRKGVGYLQNISVDHQAQECSLYHGRKRLVAVLDNFHHCKTFDVDLLDAGLWF